MKKKVYYEHDITTGTSIGLEYEKYLYQSQSKYQNIEIITSILKSNNQPKRNIEPRFECNI